MAYELPFDKFLTKIHNKELKKELSKFKLPSDAFFGETTWKESPRVAFNIDAKTSEENIKYIEKKLKIKSEGLNLNVSAGGSTVRFIKSGKASSGGSRNSLGKALADAGELATVMSFSKDIKVPKDTGQKIFIENVDAFQAWMNTFKYTKPAVEKIVGSLSSYDVLHDATDRSPFADAITSFCKKIKIAKDSWNPADIFIVTKSKKLKIAKDLQNIVDTYEVKDGLVDIFNRKIYSYYLSKDLYPISLKQLAHSKPSIDYTNEPDKVKIAEYNIEFNGINMTVGGKSKELGVFTFKNTDTNKMISLQVRGFPHGYGISQTEITSDGTPSGGRLGKISTAIVDRVLEGFDFERIKSVSWFGRSPAVFSQFDEKLIKEVYSWYTKVSKHKKVKDQNPITFEQFKSLINGAKKDYAAAENLCQQIQGLKLLYFFITHEKDLSTIMNKLINGAKKVSSDNGFFIKIY